MAFAAFHAWHPSQRPPADQPALKGRLTDDEGLIRLALDRRLHEGDVVIKRRLADNFRFTGDVSSEIRAEMLTSDPVIRKRLIQRMKARLSEGGEQRGSP